MSILVKIRGVYSTLAQKGSLAESFALLFARFAVAKVFYDSGKAKWNGYFSFDPGTYDLFLYEFFCPEEERGRALVLCSNRDEGTYGTAMQWIVERFANAAGVMEILFPILLLFGFMSRLAALGLLAMTLFIELFVFPDAGSWWGSHIWWAALCLIIIARGPGWLSLDRYLGWDTSTGEPLKT